MKIPYGKQTIDEEDINEVNKILRSNFLTTGPKIKEFEEKFASYVGSKYAVAVSSGTAALHLACLSSGLKEDDELITSPMTFAASANCALYCKAHVVFADIDEQGLIDINKIEEKITLKTKIIIPVHYSGLLCDMEKIKEIADKHSLIVVEDACHALGGRYKESKIGSCKYSDMAIFSFHPVKHITTGEGGMITTNSKYLYEKLIKLRSHGVERKERWNYEIKELGYNYRITDIQCGLGISQLNKLNNFIEKRRQIAKKYDEAFQLNENIEIIREKEDQFGAYHLYVIKLKDLKTREKLYDYLKEKGIFCQVHYIPVYWHPYYQELGYEKGLCPKAEEFYQRIISIPIYPKLEEEEQNYVIDKINEFYKMLEEEKISQNEKKILLINLSMRPNSDVVYFPIGLGYIATAIKRAGLNFDILDIEAHRYSQEEIETYLKENKYDIYCLGCIVTGYSKVKWITQKIREQNKEATIICGNSVVSSIPKITLKKTEVDIGVIAEGDITIVELIDSICNNKPLSEVKGICYVKNEEVVLTEKRPVIENISELPIIDWDLFDIDFYLKKSINSVSPPYPIPKEQIKAFVVNTARGCPFQCTFCYHAFRGRKYRYRSADSIIKELKILNEKYGINHVSFFDELTFFSKSQAEEFADKLLASGLKIFWNADVRSDLFTENDIELLKKIKQSGCLGMGYSLESGNLEILKKMNKLLKVEDFIEQKKALEKAGILTYTSIVLGYPEETKETIKETFDVLKKAKVYPSAGYLLPQPGTPMYDLAIEKGIIQDEEEYLLKMGDRQDFRINLTSMDQEEFKKEVHTQLEELSKELNLNLDKDKLIKTTTTIQNS